MSTEYLGRDILDGTWVGILDVESYNKFMQNAEVQIGRFWRKGWHKILRYVQYNTETEEVSHVIEIVSLESVNLELTDLRNKRKFDKEKLYSLMYNAREIKSYDEQMKDRVYHGKI